MMYCIYILSDPRGGRIRYVGRTQNPKNRMAVHLSKRPLQSKTLYGQWMRGMAKENVRPTMHIVQSHTSDIESRAAECSLVRELLQYNVPLVNKSRFLYAPYGDFQTDQSRCAQRRCKKTDSHTHNLCRRASHEEKRVISS